MDRTASRAPHVLLAGGGSAGHVFPALAVGDEMLQRGWRVSFAGRPESMESRLAERAGLPLFAVSARPIVGQGPVRRATALARLAAASIKARRGILRDRVAVVLGTGGYVSAPAVLGARWARRPALLLEPNASAGAANRFLSRFAVEAAVAYPETVAELRCPGRHTGVPVRAAFHRVAPELPAGPELAVLVLGGSQGARQLNELLPAALEPIAERFPDLKVVHQAGAAHLESTLAAYERRRLGAVKVEVLAFLDDVADRMAASHLVISRAGAVTLAEICAAARPSLLVPLTLAGGHQRRNAEALASAGAAAVTPAGDVGPEAFAAQLAALLDDRTRLQRMALEARGLARPAAASEIADRLAALGAAA